MSDVRDVIGMAGRSGKRVVVTIIGFSVLVAGLLMLVLPGPGILAVIAGLAILATEYAWAKSLLRKAREHAKRAKEQVRKDGRPTDGAARDPRGEVADTAGPHTPRGGPSLSVDDGSDDGGLAAS